jgi:hypothetical protein
MDKPGKRARMLTPAGSPGKKRAATGKPEARQAVVAKNHWG